MNALRTSVVSVLVFISTGCAANPPINDRQNPTGAGVHIKLRAPIKIFSNTADSLRFVRVDDNGGLYALVRKGFADMGQCRAEREQHRKTDLGRLTNTCGRLARPRCGSIFNFFEHFGLRLSPFVAPTSNALLRSQEADTDPSCRFPRPTNGKARI